jgi:NTE family protein
MGSIIGAMAAQGLDADEIEAVFEDIDWQSVGSILVRSVVGEAFHDLLREALGDGSIQDLDLPFAAVCCDLDTGEEVALSRGSIADAVRASSAIPGVLSPLRVGGRLLVDGAVVEPVPVTAASSMGSEPVLAVNVLRPSAARVAAVQMAPRRRRGGARSVMRRRVDRWFGRHQAEIAGTTEEPSRWEAVLRSFHIMQYRLAAAGPAAELGIEPDVGRFGWFDFPRVTEIVDEGYRAYRRCVSG